MCVCVCVGVCVCARVCACLCLLPLRRALLAQLEQPHKIRGTCVNVTVHRRQFNHTHISGVTRFPCGVDGGILSGQAEPFLTKQTRMMSSLAGAQRGRFLFYPASHNPTQYLLYERDSLLDFSFAFSFSRQV